MEYVFPITFFLCSEGRRRDNEKPDILCRFLEEEGTEKKEPYINWFLTFSLCSWIIDIIICPCTFLYFSKHYYKDNCSSNSDPDSDFDYDSDSESEIMYV